MLLTSIFYLRKCSYFCILLQGLWQGLLKFKLHVGLILRNSLVLEVGQSARGEVGGERQVWICVEGMGMKRGSAGSHWRLHHSPRSMQGEGSSSFAFQRAFPVVQMAGRSSPRHSFPLISSQDRDTQEPDGIQALESGRWAGHSWLGELTDDELASLFAADSGLALFKLPWVPFMLPHGLLGRHCLRLGWTFLVCEGQSDDNVLQLSGWRKGAQNNSGVLSPGHFGVFLFCCWRCSFAA